MSEKPPLIGLPREEPFPLTPYRDVLVYTPTHARPRVAVIAPRLEIPPPPMPRESLWPQAIAAAIVWALIILYVAVVSQ